MTDDDWNNPEWESPEKFVYEYKDPTTKGYTRVTLSKEEHDKWFLPNYPRKWQYRFEYYMSDKAVMFERFSSWPAVILMFLLLPISILAFGFVNIKETWKDHASLLNPKKTGSFITGTHWFYKGKKVNE